MKWEINTNSIHAELPHALIAVFFLQWTPPQKVFRSPAAGAAQPNDARRAGSRHYAGKQR